MRGMWPQLIRNLIKDEELLINAGIITLPAGSAVIHAGKSLTLVAGDRIYTNCDIKALKGGVGGVTNFLLYKRAGTAVVLTKGQDLAAVSPQLQTANHPAATRWDTALIEWLTVQTGGTYELGYLGQSLGSNATIAVGNTRFQTVVYR